MCIRDSPFSINTGNPDNVILDYCDGIGLVESPESETGAFMTMKNMKDWMAQNMPNAELNLGEFGWNSTAGDNPLGEANQAAYVMRAFMLAMRNDIHRAFLYAFQDNEECPLYCSTSLYDENGQPRNSLLAIEQLMDSDLSDKVFLNAVSEDSDPESGQYVYLFGDPDGTPTHMVAWAPEVLPENGETYPPVSNECTTIQLPSTEMTVSAGTPYNLSLIHI